MTEQPPPPGGTPPPVPPPGQPEGTPAPGPPVGAPAPGAGQPPVAAPAGAPSAGGLSEGYGVKTPMGRAILFSILSFGLWTIWWFYVNKKRLDQELGKDEAVLHTAGLFVPILNFVILYWFWRDLNDLRQRLQMEEVPVVLYLVLSIFGLQIVAYPMALPKFNEYWDRRSGGQATESVVSGGEKVVVGIGIGIFALYLLIILIIIIAAVASS
jgi:hypothetical protein